MKRLLNILFLFFLMLINCTKNDEVIFDCNVDNPLEDLVWLQEMKNSLSCSCHESIAQGVFKGHTVFYLVAPSFYCDAGGLTLWDCNGVVVKEFIFADQDPDIDNIKLVKILYSCEQ